MTTFEVVWGPNTHIIPMCLLKRGVREGQKWSKRGCSGAVSYRSTSKVAHVLNRWVDLGGRFGSKTAILGCFETAVLEVSYNQQVK
jgi:hypothetical protein